MPRVWAPEPSQEDEGVPLDFLQAHWEELKLDIHEAYGVDLDDPAQISTVSWHWFLSKIRGLITRPMTRNSQGDARAANRLQLALIERSRRDN